MNPWFMVLTGFFIIVAIAMVLIILVQRPSGGGLAGAFGGAGGGTDTVFGGRVGDALTWATVIAFALYLLSAVTLNIVPVTAPPTGPAAASTSEIEAPAEDPTAPAPEGGPIAPVTTEPPETTGSQAPAETGEGGDG